VGAPTDVVREIGGREPEDFETIVRRYLARSAFSKRRMALISQGSLEYGKSDRHACSRPKGAGVDLEHSKQSARQFGRRFRKLAKFAFGGPGSVRRGLEQVKPVQSLTARRFAPLLAHQHA
jgi:hypothetical protein